MTLLTTQQLAPILGVSERTAQRFAKRDGMPVARNWTFGGGYKIGTEPMLFDLDAVRAWLKSRPWAFDCTKRTKHVPSCPECRRRYCKHRKAS